MEMLGKVRRMHLRDKLSLPSTEVKVRKKRVRAKPGEADRSSLLLKCAAIGARL